MIPSLLKATAWISYYSNPCNLSHILLSRFSLIDLWDLCLSCLIVRWVSYCHKFLSFIIYFSILSFDSFRNFWCSFSTLFSKLFFRFVFSLMHFINNSSIFDYCISYETKLFNQYFHFTNILLFLASFPVKPTTCSDIIFLPIFLS